MRPGSRAFVCILRSALSVCTMLIPVVKEVREMALPPSALRFQAVYSMQIITGVAFSAFREL
ncbi:hypothetical protein F5B22DRAFT_583507 [Xylaria bambusicola]|uniref:uncharacterized protein n=1 Tax=Xylaria bambusicola TaxID=326684 RepID=UPI002008D436|nr:uncharacterized protein F5B22DRAFT_583507 [Xylaria bambusicola]KAI0528074.1 hypothetical protein F5B22DRAFT_583507 [Xylaria bambusicola]